VPGSKCPFRWARLNTLISMLDSEERAILEFERGWWTLHGPKDQMIEFVLGLTSYAYYERLLRLVQSNEAMRYDPLTVKRVLTMIEAAPAGELAV
jgi:hypothetical protein